MKLYRVYTLSMLFHLTELGFHYVSIVQDIKKPNYNNWMFEDTPELRQAITDFTNSRK